MTVIRIRCEYRPGVEAARADAPLRALPPTVVTPSIVPLEVTRAPRGQGVESRGPASEGASVRSASNGNRAAGTLDGLHIVIVEDDDDARDLVSIVLSNAGASVLSAASAAEGFRAICGSRPQLLISDIGMPDEDGYSLIRRIRALSCAEGGDIPAIALSAFTRPEDRMLALRAGFTLHIAKPVHPSELVSAAASLVAVTRRPERRPA